MNPICRSYTSTPLYSCCAVGCSSLRIELKNLKEKGCDSKYLANQKKKKNHWSIFYSTATLNGLVFSLLFISMFRSRCLATPRFLSRHRAWASPVRSSFPHWDNNRQLSGLWSERTLHALLLWPLFYHCNPASRRSVGSMELRTVSCQAVAVTVEMWGNRGEEMIVN